MNALVNPSSRQIAAQVDVVLQHDPSASVIGIRAQSGGTWPSSVRVGNREFSVVWCASPIAIREHLLNLSEQTTQDSTPGLVVMTPLHEKALGADVLSRFSRGKVFSVEAWDMVRHAFQAMDIDSRLARWPWVGEALLENLPASGYPPARGGLLDVDTAWFHVLRTVLGLAPEQGNRPDLGAILRWSLSPGAAQRYDALSEKARKQIRLWFAEVLGGGGELVGQILDAGYGGELTPIALVAGMVLQNESGYTRSDAETRELLAASVRLERFTGGQPVTVRDGLRLHAAAVQVTTAMDASDLLPVLDVADRMLETLHLSALAHVSDDLPSGLNGRLAKFAAAVEGFVDALRQGKTEKRTAEISKKLADMILAGRHIIGHRLASHHAPRIRRVEMAIRLARWMDSHGDQPSAGLADQIRAYAEEGAFVDAARLALLGGDELSTLSRAFALLREEARKRRDAHNELFSRALLGWNTAGCPDMAGIVPVESVVAAVAAPTAAVVPILVLLVDGLSYPIFRELIDDAQRQGWNEVLPPGAEHSVLGLATIPSITEISRTSLFCGHLTQGQAANEKTGFTNHPALAAIAPPGRGNARAVLFHKGDLTAGGDGSSLSDVVRDAIASRERKVVGVVFNAIDDHLSGSDQLNQRWALDDLRLIKPLLYEARNAGRLVLVTADHGHVIDEATQNISGQESAQAGGTSAGGDRWRSAPGAQPVPGELLFSGGRVKSPSGDTQVVVPWSESVRFGSKKNGYHGGVSLQEMVVPVALLATGMSLPDGLRHAPCKVPAWWDLVSEAEKTQVDVPTNAAVTASPRKAKAAVASDTRQPSLFESPVSTAVSDASSPVAAAVTKIDWIDGLLLSAVFQAQKQWAARAAVRDEEIRRLLEALDERGGKLSKSALAGRLAMPLMRVSGFVNAARRLLNVDQAPILVLDEVEGAVMLNRSLLEVQFQVKGRPS